MENTNFYTSMTSFSRTPMSSIDIVTMSPSRRGELRWRNDSRAGQNGSQIGDEVVSLEPVGYLFAASGPSGKWRCCRSRPRRHRALWCSLSQGRLG